MDTRLERDRYGEKAIPAQALWGLNTQRALDAFRVGGARCDPYLIAAYAQVKHAAALANWRAGSLDERRARAIAAACEEIVQGKMAEQFPLDALQGGAGTALNMNLNEVIANRAGESLGDPHGTYGHLSPLDHVNLHQSTNDTFPTALKIAGLRYLAELEAATVVLLGALQAKEHAWAHILILGRTELQAAVPMTLGAVFSGFAHLVAEDRWRVSKTRERLRVVNLGGTAVGTGLAAKREYIVAVIETLRDVTGLNLARAENPVYATQNIDAIVETSGLVRTQAANLTKMADDVRTYALLGELTLPFYQPGSSLMPGKVNPVICEAAMQAGLRVMADDRLIADAASRGRLQINEFLPLVAHAFLGALRTLRDAAAMFAETIARTQADEAACARHVDESPLALTVLVPQMGYATVQALVAEYTARGAGSLRAFLTEKYGAETARRLLAPERFTKLGYTDSDRI